MSDEDEVAQAAEAARVEGPADRAQGWLLANRHATLATTAVKREVAGFPYASIVPYALDGGGRPFILIARMAAHTANLLRDSRATLFVRDPDVAGDPQASWRISVMGQFVPLAAASWTDKALPNAEILSDADHDALHARYLEQVPKAENYLKTHSFDYWRMNTVAAVRYIAGFGRITWIEGAEMIRDPLGDGVGAAAPGAIAHMNADHADNMREIFTGLCGFTPAAVEMVGIDRSGMLLKSADPDTVRHFSFDGLITAQSLRKAVVGVLKKARAR